MEPIIQNYTNSEIQNCVSTMNKDKKVEKLQKNLQHTKPKKKMKDTFYTLFTSVSIICVFIN